MGGAKKTTWIGGTAFVALVIVAAAWFLAISPTMTTAAEIRDETEATVQQNDLLEMKVIKLAADFEKLPEYKAELEELRKQIPTQADLARLLRQLDTMAARHDVTLTAITPSVAQMFVPAEGLIPAAPEPEEDAEESEEEGEDGEAAEPSAPPASPVPDGFTAIPMSITALGTYGDTIAFVRELQTKSPRLFLVAGMTGTGQEEAEAGSGRPATEVGDLELVVTGFTYVLTDPLAVAAPVDPEAETPALPKPGKGSNPLVPVEGS